MKPENISLSTNEKMTLISNMSTMLTAGIPILETVDSLLESSKGNQKFLLQILHEDLVQGKTISSSFAKFPKIFNKVIVNIIRASEQAGTLNVTLKDLKESIKKEAEFMDRVKGALIYPFIILIVFLLVFFLILTFVVPKIAVVFSRLTVELPLPTKILILSSNIVVGYTIPFIIFCVLIGTALFLLYRSKKRRLLIIFSSLPLISKLAREIDLTRFTRSFYLLLNAGIPITSALELTEEIVIKKEIYNAILHSKERVLAGDQLSMGLKDAKDVIPPIVIKMTEAGEKSGSLEKTMQETSEYLDYQVSNSLKTLTTLLEPLMLVVAGILIGGMMLAIVSPIYGLIGQINK